MAGDFYPSDEPRPTRMDRMRADLDAAEERGALRRAGLIRDEGCDSVAAMLDEQDQAENGCRS